MHSHDKLEFTYLQGVFMFVDNQVYYGHLLDSEKYETTHLHNDLYEIFDNRYVCNQALIPISCYHD